MKAVQPGDEDVAKFLPATERIPDCLDLSELPTSARCALRKTAGGRELRKTRFAPTRAARWLRCSFSTARNGRSGRRLMSEFWPGASLFKSPIRAKTPRAWGVSSSISPKFGISWSEGGKFASNPRDRGYKGFGGGVRPRRGPVLERLPPCDVKGRRHFSVSSPPLSKSATRSDDLRRLHHPSFT